MLPLHRIGSQHKLDLFQNIGTRIFRIDQALHTFHLTTIFELSLWSELPTTRIKQLFCTTETFKFLLS